jgi:peroxiredoxin
MMGRAASLLVALAALAACGGAARSPAPAAAPPTWELPGLGGAVRPEMGSPQPGEAAPDLALPGLDGRQVSLSSMRGSWVVLHFTATWCPFCDSEVAHLGELADAYAARGVRTVIVDVEEEAPRWRTYAATHLAPSLVALRDADGAATARFAPPRAQPSFEDRAQAVLDGTLIIDPQGKIRLFLLPDSAHFDPKFSGVRRELDRLVPAPVVTIHAAAPAVHAGGRTDVAVTLRVAEGFHVMSDRPSEPTYVPTTVAIEGADGVAVGMPLYPPSSPLPLGERSLATFGGTFVVHVPLEVAGEGAPGARTLRGSARYQACTSSRCLFPATLPFELTLQVVAR